MQHGCVAGGPRTAAATLHGARKQRDSRDAKSIYSQATDGAVSATATHSSAFHTHSADAAPRVPALKLSKNRTQRLSSGTVVPLKGGGGSE